MLNFIYTYISLQSLIWLIVALPLGGALINGAIAIATARAEKARFKPIVSIVGSFTPILSFAVVCIVFYTVMGFSAGEPAAITGPLIRWFAGESIAIDIGLKIDQLSLVMALVVSGVGSLIHIYSIGYMGHDAGYARYFAGINLFLFFMLLLVLADNLVLMFVGWEGVGLCSYLLIGFWFEDAAKAKAGLKAFVVNRIGDTGFLIGMFLIFGVMSASGASPASGLFNFDTMERYGGYFVPVATWVSLLLFAGAMAKSAQIPLYVWLPDAMAGPTPVSALIHAATMVTAGVYMVVRLNFIFASSPAALHIIGAIGAATAIFAATMGLVSNDLKKILAYSTISQLGLMFTAVGLGAFTLAIFHLVTHAFFKALLFLCAGSVIHALDGEQDIRKMGGLKRKMPFTAWTFIIASAALAGIAPASGFFSKDAIMWQAWERGQYWQWVVAFIGAGLTAFYIFRVVGRVFFGDSNVPVDKWKRVKEAPVSMAFPMLTLATLSLFGGFINVPEALGGASRFITWLGQLVTFEISHAPDEGSHAELVLMALSVLWCAHFAIMGLIVYAQKRDWPERISSRISVIYKLVVNRYYVDELYEIIFVRPILWFSRKIIWKIADETVLDRFAVYGSAKGVGVLASILSAAENGVLQRYLVYFIIGAAIVVWFLVI